MAVVDAPLALYRRYRPENFSEVIGQDHVTGPLRHALEGNRVHHAYLFSGPRGCGKTTSARILARALNCEQAPTSEPCGTCDSCVSLARGGSGSIDVIEIDAASHGGVDDARDLRERAFFAPVSSRYKIYIIDEAHMVTREGFNALLKLVEEPPPHLKFVFATTEPDKVIGTIKSRTHHYPFRLVPPKVLGDYLADLCKREGVSVEPAVFPLVVRAGAGSVRDSLSVLDQLIGGAGSDGVTYPLAAALLGYTPESLLDEVVDAFAAADGGSVFGVIDKVIETGQDPRRFGEDLLRRLRDLVVIAAVPDASAKGIIDVADDQADRMAAQAARFGRADLVRAADLVGQGLTEMRGATAPRLLLELICARVLLPGADDSSEGLHARIDRIERRMAIGGGTSSAEPAPGPAPVAEPPVVPETTPPGEAAAEPAAPADEPLASAPADEPQAPAPAGQAQAPAPAGQAQAQAQTSASASGGNSAGMSVVDVRRLWPDLLEAVKRKRRFTWVMLSQNAHAAAFDGKTLTVGLVNAGARDRFVSSGSDAVLHDAASELLGVDWRVEAIVDVNRPANAPAEPPARSNPAERDRPEAAPADSGQSRSETTRPPASEPAPRADSTPRPPASSPQSAPAPPSEPSDDHAHPDDPTLDDGEGHDELLARELGAQVIEEIPHD